MAEVDLILNIRFTRIRLKLPCTIYPHTPIKSKIGGKVLSKKICQNKLLSVIFNSVKFLLRDKNEWVALNMHDLIKQA